jgi:hypothetical protein
MIDNGVEGWYGIGMHPKLDYPIVNYRLQSPAQVSTNLGCIPGGGAVFIGG